MNMEKSQPKPVTESSKNEFYENLEKSNWASVLDCNDPNEAYNVFLELYQTALNSAMPEKTTSFNRKKHKMQPWVTKGILKSVQHKNKLYKRKMNTNTEQQRTALTREYNHYRNVLNKVIRLAKQLHWNRTFNDSKHDMKQTWKSINCILQKTKNKLNFPQSLC